MPNPTNISRKYFSNPKISENLLIIISLFFLTISIFIYAFHYKEDLNFFPLNGTFQTFNPIQRLCRGEVPGDHFMPYLGLGTTYITSLITSLTGCNYAASTFSNRLIHIFCYWISLYLLFKTCQFSNRYAIVFSSFIISLFLPCLFYISLIEQQSIIDIPERSPQWFELISPYNSNLGLRSFLPFLSSLLIWIISPLLRNHGRKQAWFLGGLIGIQPLWSNDYGPLSSVVLLAFTVLFVFRNWPHPISQLIQILFACSSSFLVVGSLLTGNHLLLWSKNNFLSVASDQFWYYLFYEGKILDLNDLIHYYSHPFFLIYIFALIVITISCFRKSKPKITDILLPYIGTTVFLAGTLSCLGGNFAWRYYLPTQSVALFIIPLAIINLYQTLNPTHHIPAIFLTHHQNHLLKSFIQTVIIQSKKIIFVALLISALVSGLLSLVILPRYFLNTNSNYFYVKELGGWLPRKFQFAYQLAEQIREDTKSLQPTERILSTYASMMDVIAQSSNTTGIDYIIHALGDDVRHRYLTQFNQKKPKYITTIREDFSSLENWIRRTNWWFYRSFLPDYDPVEATLYNILWKRREVPKVVQEIKIPCNLRKQSARITDVIIPPLNIHDLDKKESGNYKKNQEIYYLDVDLNYQLNLKNPKIFFFKSRGLVNAKEVTASRKLGAYNNNYGLPIKHQNWHVPLEYQAGKASILRIKGYPENQAEITINYCEARLVSYPHEFSVIKSLPLINLSNENWKHGISMTSQKAHNSYPANAGFMIEDPELLTQIYTIDKVIFAHSGERSIIAVQGNQIWVDGGELDPEQDGYPHKVLLIQK